jgi:Uma2 family endonuclease
MVVSTQDVGTEAAVALPRPRLFTVDEYVELVNSGILGDDARVELIEGQIVEMNPIGSEHMWGVNSLTVTFAIRGGVLPSIQNPIRLPDRSMPQPDFVALRPGTKRRIPLPEDILLIAEVSDTSLRHDRTTKGLLYARAGIPEYWIVDLNGERIEVYREPAADGYRAIHLYGRGESLSPAFAPELVIQVDDILGPTPESESAD